MLSGFGEALGLSSGPPTLADLIVLVTCGSRQPGSQIKAFQGEGSDNPLRLHPEKLPLDPTDLEDPVDQTAASATCLSETGPMATETQGPSIQGPLSDIQGSVSWAAAASLSRRLHLDLATALPGEAVEALAEWIQNDAFLTK